MCDVCMCGVFGVCVCAYVCELCVRVSVWCVCVCGVFAYVCELCVCLLLRIQVFWEITLCPFANSYVIV